MNDEGIWIHLPEGRYRLVHGRAALADLRSVQTSVLEVEDEEQGYGQLVLRPGCPPLLLTGAPQAFRSPPEGKPHY